MKYTKPQISALGNANHVIECPPVSKSSTPADGCSDPGKAGAAYDLDE
jgi:hypothetical protein